MREEFNFITEGKTASKSPEETKEQWKIWVRIFYYCNKKKKDKPEIDFINFGIAENELHTPFQDEIIWEQEELHQKLTGFNWGKRKCKYLCWRDNYFGSAYYKWFPLPK